MRIVCKRVFLLFFVGSFLLLVASAHAQGSECPSGTSGGGGSAPKAQITVFTFAAPSTCQKVRVFVSVIGPPNENAISVAVHLTNAAGQIFAYFGQTLNGNSWSTTLPNNVAPALFDAYPTVGPAGRPDRIDVLANGHSAGPFAVSLTVTYTGIDEFNRGGGTIATAPAVDGSTTYKGSVNLYEHGPGPWGSGQGQYYKVTLLPGQKFRLTGTRSAHPNSGAVMYLMLHNSSGTLLAYLLTASFTGSAAPFTTSFYTNNTPNTVDVFVKVSGPQGFVHGFELNFQIDPAPQLKLFLDIRGPGDTTSFDVANPSGSDESHLYVPGSQKDGVSVAPTESGPLQNYTQIIAAFVDANGSIVTPPGTAPVQFGLTDVSRFKGIAMNLGTSQEPDFGLQEASGGGLSFNFNATDKTARVQLLAYDYGGFATVTATRGSSQATLKLPRDVGPNGLPDAGWKADSEHIDDAGNAGDDDDADGLARFEEYRGFIAGAEHIRTRPAERDLFYFSNVPLATNGVGNVSTLPVRLHRILLSQVSEQRVINWTIDTQALAEHFDQHAVLIFDGGFGFLDNPEGAAFGWVWCRANGELCVPSTVGENFVVPFLNPARNVQIQTGVIGLASSEGSDNFGEDPADAYIVNTAVAHELGHTIHIDHSQPPLVSIMVATLSPLEPWFITWYDLPSQFNAEDLAQIRFKP